jgi:ubiquinone/menaquinone biosynthesis C-methylase UbiE
MAERPPNTMFQTGAAPYERLIGRYAGRLAVAFADAAAIARPQRALDVGCGPGALTTELVQRLGADRVAAVDPSEPFAAACRERNPGVDVTIGTAEALPYPDGSFDAALAQLVLHFVSDAGAAAAEFRRVLKPGGIAGGCVWDFTGGMRVLRAFWDAALTVAPKAPDESNLDFGREGEIARLLEAAGFRDVQSGALDVTGDYDDFEDLWSGFTAGVGPSGSFCMGLPEDDRARLRAELYRSLGSPEGPFTLPARAWYGLGRA